MRVNALHEEEHGRTTQHPHDLIDQIAAQVAAGGDVDLAPMRAARDEGAEREQRMTVLNRAREMASNQLARELSDNVGAVIANHLQPAFAEVVNGLRRDFATIAHIPSDAPLSIVLTQPKNVRDAAVRIDAAVTRYDTIRHAYELVRRLGDQAETADGYGYFREIRNCEQVWPGINGLMAVTEADIPWPRTGTRDRLAWMFAVGAEPWLPTAQEQDARWLQVFGERINQQRANRSHLDAYRHMFEAGPVAGGNYSVVTRGQVSKPADAAAEVQA